jgi:hypothetical protein
MLRQAIVCSMTDALTGGSFPNMRRIPVVASSGVDDS